MVTHQNDENECMTILYSFSPQDRGYVRYPPVIKILHRSNPLFLESKHLCDGNNVTHLTFGVFEKVQANAPIPATMLGNAHLSKTTKSSTFATGIDRTTDEADPRGVLAVAKFNGSL